MIFKLYGPSKADLELLALLHTSVYFEMAIAETVADTHKYRKKKHCAKSTIRGCNTAFAGTRATQNVYKLTPFVRFVLSSVSYVDSNKKIHNMY